MSNPTIIKDEYNITGYFYRNDNKICRKVLHIHKSINIKNPDLLVIMMNPGSSRPSDLKKFTEIGDHHVNQLIKTTPDTTQKKVILFMESKQLQHAVVLNLIDICNPKSTTLVSKNIAFSNFNSIDKAEDFIKEHASSAQTVLLAWGCKKIFKKQITTVLEVLKTKNKTIYGYSNTTTSDRIYFYHPLKRGEKWLDKVEKIQL
ncbi:MAG: DUF1643 domain-containing protein [Flavobacterium sp.]|nr:DUF1643 domain-containing protein [Flavobacterium sp.]